MACNDNYLIRVTPIPADRLNGVFIYTDAKPPVIVREIPISGTRTLCFTEDPASTIRGIVIGLDANDCAACSSPNWDGRVFSVNVKAPSIGSDGGALLLKATSAGKTYVARDNPQIDGGRPIIRNPFGLVLVVATLVAVVLVVGYLWMRMRRARNESMRPV